MGQYWMKDLNNGAYRRELYVAHISMSQSYGALTHPHAS